MPDLNLQLNRAEKADALARLQGNADFQVLRDWLSTQMEVTRNELENPKNPTLQFTQGRVAAYRDIFNYLYEKLKESKSHGR